MPQLQRKRKRFGSIHADTRRLGVVERIPPNELAPARAASSLYKQKSVEIRKAIRLLVPPGRRKNIRPIKYIFKASPLLAGKGEIGAAYDELIGSRLGDKRFEHRIKTALKELESDRLSRHTLVRLETRQNEPLSHNRLALMDKPSHENNLAYRRLIKEAESKHLRQRLGLENFSPHQVITAVLRMEEERSENVRRGVAGRPALGWDPAGRVYVYYRDKPRERKVEQGTALHEIAHDIFDQTGGRTFPFPPLWKHELFAHAFEFLVHDESRLRSRQPKFESFARLRRMGEKEYVESFRGDMGDRVTEKIRRRTRNGRDIRMDAHLAALDMMRMLLEKNNNDVRKTMLDIRRIIYDQGITNPEDVKI